MKLDTQEAREVHERMMTAVQQVGENLEALVREVKAAAREVERLTTRQARQIDARTMRHRSGRRKRG